jgi:uncharacterized protein (DUF1015 family)
MTEIKPFKAFYYNPQKIGDLAKVVCPPYDVISPEQQTFYHNQSEHNFIRIILGKDRASDTDKDNKYTRAKGLFQKWIEEDTLIQEEKPCIYFYRQEYKVMGERQTRMGFIALMKLQDDHEAKIYPHENTHSKAKEDRLKLWSMLSANLSSIFVCFADSEKTVNKIFTKHVAGTSPMVDLIDDTGIHQVLWRLSDPVLIEQIVQSLANQQLFIADGHHRYEVAKEYRRILQAQGGKVDPHAPYNYVMTYFTNIESRDLRIFPMHRIVRRLTKKMDFLEEFFRSDRMKTREELMILLAKAGQNEHAFGLYTKEGIWLLRLKSKLLIDQYITEGSREYRELDATILKTFVFDRVGVASEDIMYTSDVQEVIGKVDNGQADAGFIMNPVKISQLKAVALNGEKMPPKTTYFYPKVLSGLTIYKID